MRVFLRPFIALAALMSAPASPIFLADEIAVEELTVWTTEEPENGGMQMVAPPGLPTGALPSPEGGFVVDPENIGPPEMGGYQWVSQETYESDWLAFMLASNARLLEGTEEEGEFEFPALAAHLPSVVAPPPGAPDEAVPEPASILSIVIGGAFIAFQRRRR